MGSAFDRVIEAEGSTEVDVTLRTIDACRVVAMVVREYGPAPRFPIRLRLRRTGPTERFSDLDRALASGKATGVP